MPFSSNFQTAAAFHGVILVYNYKVMKTIRFFALLICFFALSPAFPRDINDSEPNAPQTATGTSRISNNDVEILLPNYIFSNSNTKIGVQFKDANNSKLADNNRQLSFIVNGEDFPLTFNESGLAYINYTFKSGNDNLNIYFEDFRYVANVRVIPISYVIVPIALIIALLGYKLIKKNRKNGNGLAIAVEEEKNNLSAENKKPETKLNIKEVVEEEEEVFS